MAYINEGTGGVLSHSGLYTYHTFTSDGTFNPTKSRECDYILVGCGGDGYGNAGGGGGGVVTGTATLSASDYPAVIGVDNYTVWDTTFNGLTALVGGVPNKPGGDGGCGAGCIAGGTSGGVGGTGSQGGNGGASYARESYTHWAGGGGGGGGGNGTDGVYDVGGNGGIGYLWLNGVRYAGGGAGEGYVTNGTGGAGGGAEVDHGGTAGLGGGGSGNNILDDAGGSGVVIVRYLSETGGSTPEPEPEAEETVARTCYAGMKVTGERKKMGKQKYFLEYLNKIRRNVGRDDNDSDFKIIDAFNDAMDIMSTVTEMECLKATLSFDLWEGRYIYEFAELDISDMKHIYTLKIDDCVQYYDPMRYVTQQTWDAEIAPYIHTATGRPTMFTVFDNVLYVAGVPDSNEYVGELRFMYWPAHVTSILSEVDVVDFDPALLSIATAFTWLKLEEVELYREWMTKAGQENKTFRMDALKMIDFIGKSNTRRQVSVGPSYWSDPFVKSAR